MLIFELKLLLHYPAIMRINSNFIIRNVAGETLVVNQGTPDINLTRVISLNASAVLLWKQLQGQEFTLPDAVHILMNHYRIEYQQAEKDAGAWVEALRRCGVITE